MFAGRGDEEAPKYTFETPRRVKSQTNPSTSTPLSVKVSARKIVGFRSSILRENPESSEDIRRDGLSKTDIRASPRLLGYLFQLLASTVMLITVIQFYREKPTANFFSDVGGGTVDKRIYASKNGPVFYWKLIGCVAVGAAGAGMSLVCILIHFDTIFLPRLWFAIFRDGSKWEEVLLIWLLLFWVGGLYVCTSSLSVGEVQANVYFTSWICFLSAGLNYGVWRVSAGKPSIAEKINFHHRETTYNWFWTLFFVCVFALSATDIYLNRNEITLRIKGEVINLSHREWIMIISIIWGFVGICLCALFFNHYLTRSIEFKLCDSRSRFVIGWRHVEGVVILGMLGVFFWFTYALTGADGVVNGLNNGYFSVWGSFFNSVFTFGTWLRENKNIEYIVRSGENNRRRSQAP